MRRPIEGGDPEDITPDLPLYASWGLALSRAHNRIGLLATYENAFHVYGLDIERDGMLRNLRELYTRSRLLVGVLRSHDGDVLTIMSSERTGRPQFSLLALDTASGETIAELWDGGDNSLEMMVASPLPGDARLLTTTTRTGIETLLIWNPRTGERLDLTFDGVAGAVRAFDWSPDGEAISSAPSMRPSSSSVCTTSPRAKPGPCILRPAPMSNPTSRRAARRSGRTGRARLSPRA